MARQKRERTPRNILLFMLMDKIYTPFKEREQQELLAILREHVIVTGNPHKYFHYKGNIYKDQIPDGYYCQSLLHESLHDRMDVILKERKEMETFESPAIRGIISKALNLAKSNGDVFALLPDSLYLPTVANSPIELSTEQINEFKEANKQWLDVIRVRMLNDALLS